MAHISRNEILVSCVCLMMFGKIFLATARYQQSWLSWHQTLLAMNSNGDTLHYNPAVAYYKQRTEHHPFVGAIAS
jgi:hypothetical protein